MAVGLVDSFGAFMGAPGLERSYMPQYVSTSKGRSSLSNCLAKFGTPTAVPIKETRSPYGSTSSTLAPSSFSRTSSIFASPDWEDHLHRIAVDATDSHAADFLAPDFHAADFHTTDFHAADLGALDFGRLAEPDLGGLLDEAWPEDTTTVMIRNIAARFSKEDVIRELEALGLAGMFINIGLPLGGQSRKRLNLGYAFVTFNCPESAKVCRLMCHGRAFGQSNSTKVCEVLPARMQHKPNRPRF